MMASKSSDNGSEEEKVKAIMLHLISINFQIKNRRHLLVPDPAMQRW